MHFPFFVTDLDSPIIQPAVANFTAGNASSITCTATGLPTPTLAWSKNGGSVIKTGSSYTWSSISVTDAGTYTCTASNTVGHKSTSKNVQVNCKQTHSKPVPYFS